MPLHESEAIILRSYPLAEADRLVSFLSRTIGRVRGVAAGARRLLRQWIYRQESKALNKLLRPHARGAVSPKDQGDIFGRHEVCLNFSNVWSDGRPGSQLIPHVRLRDFEAPMCRSTYLTGHSEEIAEFYDIGREIDTYSSDQELVDKTRFYLNNPGAADKLRDAGYRRAIRDHTWVQRFRQLFDEILPTEARRQ